MSCHGRESNPISGSVPYWTASRSFGASKGFAVIILKRFSKCPTIFLKDSLDCLVWESLNYLAPLLVCHAQEKGTSTQGTHPYVYLRNWYQRKGSNLLKNANLALKGV